MTAQPVSASKQKLSLVASTPATGLGCLVIIGRRFGLNLSVSQLIHQNMLTLGELAPDHLMQCARRTGFRCNLVKIGWPALAELNDALPAIALRKDGTSFVVDRAGTDDGRESVAIEDPDDPSSGSLVVPRAVFEDVWSGDVILIRPDSEGLSPPEPFGLKMILKLLLKDRRATLDIVVSAIVISLMGLLTVAVWMVLQSFVVQVRAFNTFVLIVIAAAIFIVFEGVFTAVRRNAVANAVARTDHAMSLTVFDRLLNLPIDYYESHALGDITYKIGQLQRIRTFLTGQVFGSLLDCGVLFIFAPLMLWMNPFLTLIVLGFTSLVAIWIIIMLPFYRRRAILVERSEAERSTLLSQTVLGMRTIKTLALDERHRIRWDQFTARTARLRLSESNMRNLIQTVFMPIERLALSGTMAVGVYFAITDGSVGATTLYAFFLLTQRVMAPLVQLSQVIQQYDEAMISMRLVEEIFVTPPEEGRSGHGVRVPLKGHVEFVNLSFKYKGAASPALRSVSFEAPAGITLGIMGRSGSGKTTITRLLQRLHSDYQGLIKVDGVDVREYDIDHLRSSLGVVLQENFLFSGTIRENITIAKSDATFEEVVQAARLAGAEEFIDKLPAGYDTYIYEGSPNLSGGQRQRLAIARALITDPKLLILDEATSALDAESEAIVNANLRRIAQGRTMLVISHRLSSLINSDAIMVLDRGEVHDIGKHHELLERCDIYSGLWYHQNAHMQPQAKRLLAGGAIGQ